MREKELESEVMGTVKKGVTSQSDIKERNLSQMISVLHMRLANLEKRQKERFVIRVSMNSEPTARHGMSCVLCTVYSVYVYRYTLHYKHILTLSCANLLCPLAGSN